MSNLYGLYEQHKHSVVRITVRNFLGDLETGTGFHIGDGLIATARHVVEGENDKGHLGSRKEYEIQEIVGHLGQIIKQEGSPYYLEDPKVDIAIIKTDFDLERLRSLYPNQDSAPKPCISVSPNLEDASIDESFILSTVLLMGYPPIPRSDKPVLVTMRAEVNAIVDRWDGPHPHFIISSIPRGGFSGGPVLSEEGTLLGVMTDEFFEKCEEHKGVTVGFAAVITTGPLCDLIERIPA